AERKAAALSLDATLLAELLGKDGIKQLLDAGVIASIEADLQCLSADKQVRTPEQMFDLLRTAGPFTRSELTVRSAAGLDVAQAVDILLDDRRVVELRIAGGEMLAIVEDISRLRDGLGIPIPPGVAATFTEAAVHPIDDLVLRWARTHGPFVISSVAERYGLGRAVVESACDGLVNSGTLVAGSFVDLTGEAANERRQNCHSRVLALIKNRTLALLRKGVEPVEQVAFARFLAGWQGAGPG